MFIVIEGLDAAGKNTTANLIAEKLNKTHGTVSYYDKNSFPVMPNDIGASFEHLHQIIYNKKNQHDYNEYPKQFWVTLQASWFDLQYKFGIKPLLEVGHVVCSGCYYKFMAKYVYKGIDSEWIRDVFKHVCAPDMVILLDFDSRITVKRRIHFTDTEVGYLDGFKQNRELSFVEYQNGLLTVMKRLLHTNNGILHISEYVNSDSDVEETVNACIKVINDTYGDRLQDTIVLS